ncbi:hypothetical protein ACFY8W_33555 [Streptomyces sp. NPDC012637]|uniref:hypothetical protein n=1 Tax=Streptomyces sp. NPDC012637 TaxID=3364842 RepID=UPI0036E7F07A
MNDRKRPTGPPPGPQSGPPDRESAGGRRRLATHALAAVAGIGVGVLLGMVLADDNGSGGIVGPTVTVTAQGPTDAGGTTGARDADAASPATSTSPLRGAIPGDGTFFVGAEVKPGTYRSEGPSDPDSPYCSWARLKGTTGNADDLLAADGSKGQVTVTILASDKAFKTTGCKPWHKAD